MTHPPCPVAQPPIGHVHEKHNHIFAPTQQHCNVSQTASLARELAAELPEVPQGFTDLTSLGNFGKHKSNEERDLHSWTKRAFGNQLQKYKLKLDVSWVGCPNTFAIVWPLASHKCDSGSIWLI